jgi:hypothetical protein
MWQIDEGELSRFRCHVGELMSLALDENLRRLLAKRYAGRSMNARRWRGNYTISQK